MFTGIIEEIGKVLEIRRFSKSIRLKISSNFVTSDIQTGSSVCVNGACLTVVQLGNNFFEVDVVEETIKRTNLGFLTVGTFVNLERARKFNDRIDGHIVQGHIDAIGRIVRVQDFKEVRLFNISYPQEFKLNLVEKGSIAVDGISLTIAELNDNFFGVSIIPYTFENTNLKFRKVGDLVNLEFDILGKYVLKYLKWSNSNNKTENSILKNYYQQPDL